MKSRSVVALHKDVGVFHQLQGVAVHIVKQFINGKINFMHRGGKYIKPTEVFGPGVFYQQ
jgi:hypothetical protein